MTNKSGSISENTSIAEALVGNRHKTENKEDIILVSESLNISGSVSAVISTNTSLLKNIATKCLTNLNANIFNITKCVTNFIEKYNIENKVNTNLALRVSDFDLLDAESLNNIIVYLDSIELTDIDYDTLKIKLVKNSTPSRAEFNLKRYYDKFDYKLTGEYSQISNKNKIEIYDGIKKIFIGYITSINCQGDGEIVSVIAEDARYKLRDNSIELYYGFYAANEKAIKEEEGKIIYENTKNAMQVILNQAVLMGYISGYEDLEFGFIPEGTGVNEAYGTIIDTLLSISGNYFWYIDINEKICFGKLQGGTTKELTLNLDTEHAHIYNILDHYVKINQAYNNYNTALNIIFSEYQQKTYTRWTAVLFSYPADLKDEFTFFQFRRQSPTGHVIKYIAEGQNYYPTSSYELIYFPNGLPYFFHISQRMKYSYITPEQIIIGTGGTVKTTRVSVSNKTIGTIYKEISGSDLRNYYYGNTHLKIYANAYEITGSSLGVWTDASDVIYLCEITEEGNDTYDYVVDGANYELSQNNNLLTEGNISILLDAINYYDISLKDRINIGNTKQSGIYQNSNGFPLNIQSIVIDCSNRVCSIELSNEGKSFYSRTVNVNKYYNKQKIKVLYRKDGT
jgi:hypothetical protein